MQMYSFPLIRPLAGEPDMETVSALLAVACSVILMFVFIHQLVM